MAKCSVCSGSITYNSSRKDGVPYFQCWRYTRGLHNGSQYIRAHVLEDSILSYFESILNGSDFSFEFSSAPSKESNEESILRAELKSIEAREERVRYAYEAGVDTLEEYKKAKERICAERSRIESLLDDLVAESKSVTKDQYLDRLQHVYSTLKDPSASIEEKSLLLKPVCKEIIWDKENYKLSFVLFYA